MKPAITAPLTIAVPKGRILQELQPLMQRAGIYPEEAFFDEESRALQFSCKDQPITLIRVRSFDVPTFVAFGGAQAGIAGSDVLMEFDYSDLYQPLDLNIGHCRLSVAMRAEDANESAAHRESHVRVATKYPNITRGYFADRGVQAECIHLNGAMELAPAIGLSQRIVDLVSSGATLKANGLVEVEKIMDVTSRLIVHRGAFKTRGAELSPILDAFREALSGLGIAHKAADKGVVTASVGLFAAARVLNGLAAAASPGPRGDTAGPVPGTRPPGSRGRRSPVR